MRNHSGTILSLLVSLFFGNQTLIAQSVQFLPSQAHSFTYSLQSSQLGSYFDLDSSKRDLLEQRALETGLDNTLVSGSIVESSLKHSFHYQFGITNFVNLVVNFSMVDYKRSSNLKDKSSGDTSAVNFIQKYKSSTQTGLGDFELGGIWRTSYGDEHDLRLSLLYKHDNGEFVEGDSEDLSPGSGIKTLTPAFLWTYYFIENQSQINFAISNRISQESEVKDYNGKNANLKRAAKMETSIGFQTRDSLLNYGFKILYATQKNSYLDDTKYENGFIQYAYKIHAGWEQITNFQESSRPLPMEGQVYLQNSFSGINAPSTQEIGLRVSAYF